MVRIKSPKAHPGFFDNEFEISEGNIKTVIRVDQGLDLTVAQRIGKQSPTYLSHYSNPGTMFYAGIIKFLHENHVPIPLPKKHEVSDYELFEDDARFCGAFCAVRKFPIEYVYHLGGIRAKMESLKENNQPILKVTVHDGKQLIFSASAAQALAKTIPLLYPGATVFQQTLKHYFMERKKLEPKTIARAWMKRKKKTKKRNPTPKIRRK